MQVDDDAHKSRVMRVKVENGTVMEADNVQGVMKAKNVMGVMEAENSKKAKVEKTNADNVEVKNKPESPIYNITMSLSAKPPVAERFADGRVLDTAFLQKGPDGKVVAIFDGMPHTFDAPNVVLDKVAATAGQPPQKGKTVKKGKKGKKVKKGKKDKKVEKAKGTKTAKDNTIDKTPKAKIKIANRRNSNVERPTAMQTGVLPVKPTYGVMYYKKGHTIGIRQKFGLKRQVFGFGGRPSLHKHKAAMKKVGQDIVTFLEADNDLAYSEAKSEGQRRSEAL